MIDRLEEILEAPKYLTPNTEDMFDVAIIGAGPAGMSAALCCARARLKTLLIEKALPGGQASTAYNITNYPGVKAGILGEELTQKMEAQIEKEGIYYLAETVDDIVNIGPKDKALKTELGNTYRTKSVIIAIGLEPKPLKLDTAVRFLGRGISYYAQCDANAYTDQDVAVIGGGNCACYAAIYLAQYAKKVFMIHRSDSLKAVKSLREQINTTPNIQILWNSEVQDAFGIDKIEKIKVVNTVNFQHTWIDIRCAFVYVGRIPPARIVSLDIEKDEKGFIITDEYMHTSVPGIYAVGDIRCKQIRQIATAVSDGMIAAINVERDLERR